MTQQGRCRQCTNNVVFRLLVRCLFLAPRISSVAASSYPGGYGTVPPPPMDAEQEIATKKSQLIDLRFNAAIKCLLMGPCSTHYSSGDDDSSQLEPLFPTPQALGQNLHFFATAERRHETNHVGALFRWKRNNKKKTNQKYMPTNTDLASEWTLNANLDSISLRFHWDDPNNSKDTAPTTLELRASVPNRLAQLGCRFPVFRRLHLWGICHVPWNSVSFEYPSMFHNGPIDAASTQVENDEWCVPDIVVDPFGMVTTDNHYVKPLRTTNDNSNDHTAPASLLKFRFCFRSQLSFLSSAILQQEDDNVDPTSDTSLFLECSHIDTRRYISTTGRLEAPLDLTHWRQSAAISDSRLLLIHERLITPWARH